MTYQIRSKKSEHWSRVQASGPRAAIHAYCMRKGVCHCAVIILRADGKQSCWRWTDDGDLRMEGKA